MLDGMAPLRPPASPAPPLLPPPPGSPPSSPLHPPDADECTLLGGTFALLIQAALATGAITTLVYKRTTETPRRPWLVWAFDASKQAFAGVLQHIVNLALGVMFATNGGASECAWYIVNFALSVICGCFILWVVMKVYRWAVARYQLRLLVSGDYGNPPQWKPFLAQVSVEAREQGGEPSLLAREPARCTPTLTAAPLIAVALRVGCNLHRREADHRRPAHPAASPPAVCVRCLARIAAGRPSKPRAAACDG